MTNTVTTIEKIHNAFIAFGLRAESATSEALTQTFVDSAPLLQILSNQNNSITFGRRGTGKTHALRYLEGVIKSKGDEATYIDLRSVGSNTSIYNDHSRPISERASQLINDVLQAILSAIYPLAVARIDKAIHKEQITLRLDDFQNAISSVKIVGTIEETMERYENQSTQSGGGLTATISKSPSITANLSASSNSESNRSSKVKNQGVDVLHLDFGDIQSSLAGLIDILGIRHFWILFDEWSEVPYDLQPYLADLIRRTLLPIRSCKVKVGAIEHRSNFMIRGKNGSYIGLELGADMTANINLDDFLVFDSDGGKSVLFFKNLLFKHYISSDQLDPSITTPDALIQAAFTQQNVFSEFVRAVEGVPRDALNLATGIATIAYGRKINMVDVKTAARNWYQRDKHASIRSNEELVNTLTIIVNEVIKTRKSRAFLFSANTKHEYLEALFDARLLHVLKRNVSSNDEPGVRYDVFKIDYGCYVDLISTANEPQGLFQVDEGSGVSFVEVPKDDYRSIRRAILKADQLDGLPVV